MTGTARDHPRRRPSRPARWSLTTKDRAFGIVLLLPAAVIILGLLAFPIGMAIAMAFMRVDLTRSREWTWNGLANFQQIARDPTVLDVGVRTLYFAGLVVTAATVLGVAFAVLLNERFPGRRWLGVVVFLPWAVAPIAAGATWQLVFHVTTGLLNGVLVGVGIIPRNVGWLNDGTFALHAAILGQVWLAVPLVSLVVLARLRGIPAALYRAAEMDGARRWGRFRHITLPSLRSTLVILVVLQTVISLQTFDLVYSLTKGGPALSTVVFNMLIYSRSFVDLRLSYGAALGLVLLVVVVIANLFIVVISRGSFRVPRA